MQRKSQKDYDTVVRGISETIVKHSKHFGKDEFGYKKQE